jgi:hypothetical protein
VLYLDVSSALYSYSLTCTDAKELLRQITRMQLNLLKLLIQTDGYTPEISLQWMRLVDSRLSIESRISLNLVKENMLRWRKLKTSVRLFIWLSHQLWTNNIPLIRRYSLSSFTTMLCSCRQLAGSRCRHYRS